jgi:membrane-associated phospholipid phosphatase
VRVVRIYPYVFTTVAVTLAFLAVAYAVSAHIGVPVRDPEGALLGRRMISPVLLMVLFAYLDAVRRAWLLQRGGTKGRLLRLSLVEFRERWWWKRLLLAVVGFMSFAFTYLAYRNLKSFVALINYRSYDQQLTDLDHWMAFGHDPATLMHDLLGTGFAAHVLSWIYLIYIPLVAVSVSIALAFVERMREAYVFVATYMYCWILGTISYYAIPTLGPFATDSRLFDKLDRTGVTGLQDALTTQRFTVISDNLGEERVAGIAGFASLHVGVVVAAWLLLRYYRQRTLSWVIFAFLVPTVISTIYFGWHFLIDDIAGFLIGWFSLLLGRATVYPRVLMIWRRKATRAVHLDHAGANH